jgi:hypothetical protein
MRRMTGWRAGVLAALAALVPGEAFGDILGQSPSGSGGTDYALPETNLPLPLYSTNPALGGLYLDGGFLMYEQTNPLRNQELAIRGFTATDLSLGLRPGTFVGPATKALDVHQVTGPSSYQPGFTLGVGYRFSDGSVFSIDYQYFTTALYTADATLSAHNLQFGVNQAATFLSSFVYNFPAQYAGPPFKIPFGAPEALYGIWNGASAMTESFRQVWWQLEASYRVPIFDTECYRVTGIVGPRYFRIQDTFQWVTTDIGGPFPGLEIEQPSWVGVYNNIVSNDMYGVHAGVQQEYYLGWGFAAMLTVQGAAFIDVVREEAEYQFGDKNLAPQRKRTIRQYTLVPEIQATPAIQWYPWEGVQVRLGYDLLAFFNTISSPQPVDFNYSSVDPGYARTFRFFNGFMAAVAIVF